MADHKAQQTQLEDKVLSQLCLYNVILELLKDFVVPLVGSAAVSGRTDRFVPRWSVIRNVDCMLTAHFERLLGKHLCSRVPFLSEFE